MIQSEENVVIPKVQDKYDSATVRDTAFIYLMTIQFWQMAERRKVTCGCETFISANSLHESMLIRRKKDEYIQNLNGSKFKNTLRQSRTFIVYYIHINIMNVPDHKYQKARGIASETIYPNPDWDI